MNSILSKYFNLSRSQSKKNKIKNYQKKLIDFFFETNQHDWIRQGHIRLHFNDVLNRLPISFLEDFIIKRSVIFLPSEEIHFDNHNIKNQNTVVIYPKFQKLLHSSAKYANAFIAHEIGTLYTECFESNLDFMLTEIKADKFVCELGLDRELELFLLSLDECEEKRLRLTYLTFHTFENEA